MGYRNKRGRNIGLERALQHIEEARELSDQLGGTDNDVKEYFFNLNSKDLKDLLSKYGKKYGPDKKEYAEKIFPYWKSGKTAMSGLVAGRLYDLLPPMMPLEQKYSMIQALWEKYGPKSEKILTFGKDNSIEQLHKEISAYLTNVVQDWEISDNLKKRFDWLSQGDVKLREKLLNHFKDLEKKQILDGLKLKLPVLKDFFIKNDEITKSVKETVVIGNHKLTIKLDDNTKEIIFSDPIPETEYNNNEAVKDYIENKSKFPLWLGVIGLIGFYVILTAIANI